MATVKQRHERLFEILALAAECRTCEFHEQNLANLSWAYARVKQTDGSLFRALTVHRRMGELKAQSIANTAWAFTTRGHLDVSLFNELARAAEQRQGCFAV
eukprot:gnl/TRDRNA2_/TRDRNA2_175252_c23_seq11.p2 gnl/TRDRNA2_/TRDRNA2_175252_c23~~gnl/TRDRNA2_/TRDRNA2_175252_c23_seq11.p2  ORF type:complete len:101 (+),score=16.54 gnl/TRDRNA2_/TRDRNA2_175252_c23_seq11:243-545(+)